MNLECTENCALMHRFLCKYRIKIELMDKIVKKVSAIQNFHPSYKAFFGIAFLF
jgi:hypothetical protein